MNNNSGEISSGSIFVLGDTEPYSDPEGEAYEFDHYDLLYIEDEDYVEDEKENNSYHIGSCYSSLPYLSNTREIYLSLPVSVNLFFKNHYFIIRNYLKEYGGYNFNYNNRNHNPLQRRDLPEIEIMKMQKKSEGHFCHNIVILKTYWLRIIQRNWKRIFKERKYRLNQRMKIKNLLYRETHGTYPYPLASIPNIYGMLRGI